MKKPLKILFPTDFSEPSAQSLVYALRMADKLNASIELLHVVYPNVGSAIDVPLVIDDSIKEMVDVAYDLMRSFKEKSLSMVDKEVREKAEMTINVEIGIPGSMIVNNSVRNQIDMIVMSSRGLNKSGIDKYMGSIAVDVVKESRCPVFIVPEHSVFSEGINLAYATDLDLADPFEIWQSVKMLQALEPKVHVVHVNFGKDGMKEWKRMEEMKEFLTGKDIPEVNFYHIPGNNLETSLNEFVEQKNIDLLVMYQKERGFWSRIFHRSNTSKMTIHTKVPLIVQKA